MDSTSSTLDVLETMETLPRHDPGIDWGAPRRVLARSKDGRVRLFIRGGHTMAVGARGFGREYQPMAVILWAAKSWHGFAGHSTETVGESRLDLAALRSKHGTLIDKVFACPGLSERLDRRRTIVVG